MKYRKAKPRRVFWANRKVADMLGKPAYPADTPFASCKPLPKGALPKGWVRGEARFVKEETQ